MLNPGISTGKRHHFEEERPRYNPDQIIMPGTMYGKDHDFSLRTDDIPGASPVKNPHL